MSEKKALVCGDIMLDTYVFGNTNRISPEAPVPVLNITGRKTRYVPGGAANVAVNIAATGIKVDLFSIAGSDSNCDILLELLQNYEIGSEYIYTLKDRPTTSKLRYIGQNNQQILRVDDESTEDVRLEELDDIFNRIKKNIDSYDIVVISDYKKGFLTYEVTQKIIGIAQDHNIPVLVDVKDKNFDKYSGAMLLKPNREELKMLTGMCTDTVQDAVEASKYLCNEAGCQYVWTTLGADGMIIVDRNGLIYGIDAIMHDVYDVTGAGDTSLAYFAYEFVKKKEVKEAMIVANYAAAIQVSKVGTSVVYPDEVRKYIETDSHMDKEKIIHNPYEIENLSSYISDNSNKKVVFTNGCFDILHIGHVDYLRKARMLGDCLVIGVNSDASVKRLKGNDRPINCLEDRMEILAALDFVDYVIPFEEDTPYNLIKKVMPDVLVKGGDYNIENIVGADIVKQKGGLVTTIAFVDGKSTTGIINKIKE